MSPALIEAPRLLNGDAGVEKKTERKVTRHAADKSVTEGVYLSPLPVFFFKLIAGEFNIFIRGIGRYSHRINSRTGESEIYLHKFPRHSSFAGDASFMDDS